MQYIIYTYVQLTDEKINGRRHRVGDVEQNILIARLAQNKTLLNNTLYEGSEVGETTLPAATA